MSLFFFFFVALVSLSEEVRSRCHVKHTLPRWPMESHNPHEIISDTTNLSSQAVSTWHCIPNNRLVLHHHALDQIFFARNRSVLCTNR